MQELINNPKTSVVDVREVGEYMQGHYEGAINIPLGTIPNQIDKFKSMEGPIIVYCRSGNRSGMAQNILKQMGIPEVYNGGGLHDMLVYSEN
ncbi:rhodanese-like domain-containing protein [Aquirufa rosea]|uniref:Rhodanese-like domain-containing protein n=2 Tax=Aquirufa rosea TaxID=2509241 RepID=A0A4Q1BY42_9BACT|nr:rhodanese-like domain-containing protein [Aquirufa rosea]